MTTVDTESVETDGGQSDNVDPTGTVANAESTDDCVPRESLLRLHTLFARCFSPPDDATVDAIHSGRIVDHIEAEASTLGIEINRPTLPPNPYEAYLRTFAGFDGGAHAPPAESVYKPWWDGTDRGILSGPPAHDMARRYEAVDIETPDAYPDDHIALELEYASLLVEHHEDAAYIAFANTHLDWIPRLRERIEETTAVAFHIWAAQALETVVSRTVTILDESTDTHDEWLGA